MLGSGGVHGEVREVDVGLKGRGQLHLGLLSGLADSLKSHRVFGQVNTLLRNEKESSGRFNLAFSTYGFIGPGTIGPNQTTLLFYRLSLLPLLIKNGFRWPVVKSSYRCEQMVLGQLGRIGHA